MKKLNYVLLIDDDDDDNYFHRLILEESSLVNTIKVIDNSFEALDFIRHADTFPDLIFLDANMPKMNGWEFVEEYKKLSHQKKTNSVIIMLSTSLNPADKKRAKAVAEINGFETKPLTSDAFEKIVQEYF